MAHQGAIDRRATRHRGEALVGQPGADRPRSPPRVRPAQLDHPGLDDRGHLVRTALGLGALVGQRRHAPVRIAAQPGVDGLAADPVAAGDVGHVHPVEDVDHRSIALFHQLRAPPTRSASFGSVDDCVNSEEGGNGHVVDPLRHEVSSRYRSQCRPGTGTASGKCQAGTGATVSSMNRNFTCPRTHSR